MTVSKKQVLFKVINGGYEFPGSFTYTFEIINFIGFGWFNFFVIYIFGYADQIFLDIVKVKWKMF